MNDTNGWIDVWLTDCWPSYYFFFSCSTSHSRNRKIVAVCLAILYKKVFRKYTHMRTHTYTCIHKQQTISLQKYLNSLREKETAREREREKAGEGERKRLKNIWLFLFLQLKYYNCTVQAYQHRWLSVHAKCNINQHIHTLMKNRIINEE